MKLITLMALFLLAFTCPPARADVPVEKKQEIEKLLKATGVEKMMAQMIPQMIASFKGKDSGVSDAFWNKLEAGMDTRSLIEKFVPIYDKHYTLEDLKAMNAFYATSAGQHLLTAMPQVMQESMAIGQQWGQEVAGKVKKAMDEEKAGKGGK